MIWLHNLLKLVTKEIALGTIIVSLLGVLGAIIFGLINVIITKRSIKNQENRALFKVVTNSINNAIQIIEALRPSNVNDSFSWAVMAEQLSSFHNIACNINNKQLRKCYCAKLHSYILRIRNILVKVDDYRFYYGIPDYKNKDVNGLLREAYKNHTNISPNALGCIMQFMILFHGARGDYMFNQKGINNILQPVFCGFKTNCDLENMEALGQPFVNICQYIREWSEGIKKQ